MTSLASRGSRIYLAGACLALLALAFGAWDVWVERDGGEDLLMQILFPALLVGLMLELYRRSRNPTLP